MSMNSYLNSMRMQAGIAFNATTICKIGLITSYDPSTSLVTVNVMPDETGTVLTGTIPLATSFNGLVAAPKINDQAICVFVDGNINLGVVVGILYNDEDQPPNAQSGEWWLVHQSGSKIKITNDGNVTIEANNNVIINATGDATINATGAANVNASEINFGNGGTLLSIVNANFQSLFNSHTHGGGPIPNQQITAAELSQVVKVE